MKSLCPRLFVGDVLTAGSGAFSLGGNARINSLITRIDQLPRIPILNGRRTVERWKPRYG